ncbi:MAG: aminotransferase class V-fold PLP-dependent enzyme [Chloroflexota bacterium]
MQRPAAFTVATGPSIVSDRVRAAQGLQSGYHDDPAFKATFRRLERAVAEVLRTRSDIVLMQGEAVLGLEAALAATIRPGMTVINVASGPYGKGMGWWMANMGATVVEVETGFREVPSVAMVADALRAHPEAELLSVVHVETPCGTLAPIAEIGPLCHAAGVVSLVDAVASTGGVDVRTDEWQLDIVVTAPEKALGGPTGLSLISVSEQAWALVGRNPKPPRASFLSMLDWKTKWVDGDDFPYTPSIADVHGALAACEAFLEEGHDAVLARHAATAAAARAGVRAMGLELWPRHEADMSPTVTAVALPAGLTDAQVVAHVRERYGVQISGADGAGDLVRLGHIGETARSLHPVVGLAALGQGLRDLGVTLDLGAGLEAALAVLSANPNP